MAATPASTGPAALKVTTRFFRAHNEVGAERDSGAGQHHGDDGERRRVDQHAARRAICSAELERRIAGPAPSVLAQRAASPGVGVTHLSLREPGAA